MCLLNSYTEVLTTKETDLNVSSRSPNPTWPMSLGEKTMDTNVCRTATRKHGEKATSHLHATKKDPRGYQSCLHCQLLAQKAVRKCISVIQAVVLATEALANEYSPRQICLAHKIYNTVLEPSTWVVLPIIGFLLSVPGNRTPSQFCVAGKDEPLPLD